MFHGKITVKHYLNKRAKPRSFAGQEYYPLYIQLIAAGQRAQLKSKIPEYLSPYRNYLEQHFSEKVQADYISQGYFSEKVLQEVREEGIFPLDGLLQDETNIIASIIEDSLPDRKNSFSLVKFSDIYELHLRDVYQIAENAVKKKYLEELKFIFSDSTRSAEKRRVFKLSNYFIHYINWENNFCDYYEATYEVLPSEIKFIENHLSDRLKLQIKALLAFHSRHNIMKRYMDKTDKGLFPTVNFVDWRHEGKDFLSREFIKIFGKQKAMEYISIINEVLSKEMNNH